MPRTAVIGPQIVEAVEKLVGEGKTRTEAFNEVAQERGMKPGSVAANFYRVQRKDAPKSTRPRRPRESAPMAPAIENANGHAPGAIDLVAQVQALVNENAAYRAENETLKSKLAKIEFALA